MADSQVPITAGSGTNIDTQVPTGGDHRQVVVLGDPNTIAGVAAVDATFGVKADVGRLIPGTTATALGKAEDAAHVDGDTGVMMLGVRNHYLGASTDGDYSAFSVDTYGAVRTIGHRDLTRIQVISNDATNANFTLTTTTPSYVIGDVIGGIWTIPLAVRVANGTVITGGGSGTIVGATLVNTTSTVIGPCDVMVYDALPSLTGTIDNNPPTYTSAPTDGRKCIGAIQLSGPYTVGATRVLQAQNVSIPFAVQSAGTALYCIIIARSSVAVFTNSTDLTLTLYIERN